MRTASIPPVIDPALLTRIQTIAIDCQGRGATAAEAQIILAWLVESRISAYPLLQQECSELLDSLRYSRRGQR